MGLILEAKGFRVQLLFGLCSSLLLMLCGIDPNLFFYILGLHWKLMGDVHAMQKRSKLI